MWFLVIRDPKENAVPVTETLEVESELCVSEQERVSIVIVRDEIGGESAPAAAVGVSVGLLSTGLFSTGLLGGPGMDSACIESTVAYGPAEDVSVPVGCHDGVEWGGACEPAGRIG